MTITPPENTTEVREAHRFDEARLERWLRANVAEFGGSLVVRQFRGGQSNPTFWLTDGHRAYVLRKKPPGPLLPRAHAVDREYRVMRALAGSEVPVAKVYALCEDDAVIGTAFYVMEHLSGRIFWSSQLPGLSREERAAIYEEFIRVLAALHRVDVDAVGLSDYGKRGGYVERQVKTWSQQYQAARTEDIPTMEKLMAWLAANVPASDETTLSHGDYRMDNVIFHPTEPRALALLDWELSTLGHPMADLAYTCMLYDVDLPSAAGLRSVDYAATGIPSEEAFIARYCELTGRTSVPSWSYFKAFSLFRLAAIAQGVYRRSQLGNASSEQAAEFQKAPWQLSEVACRIAGIL